MAPKQTSEAAFISRAREVHDNKYVYPDPYVGPLMVEIRIICPKHGEFWQSAGKHISGQGCKKCAVALQTMTFDTFVKKSREKHGDKYLYDENTFSKSTSSVRITCKEHGNFQQVAYKHYGGHGCPKCKLITLSVKQAMTFKDFEKRAKVLFKNRYIFHEETFVKGNANILVTCRIHGLFEKNACSILAGQGCPKCGAITGARKAAAKNRIPFDEFVRRAKLVFKDKYTYSVDEYTSITRFTEKV